MAKWWDNIKERLGIGKSEQDREFEKQLKEAEERSLKEQEREAKKTFFPGLRSDEKTEQRQVEAQNKELSKLEKGFARNEQNEDRKRNDPAFKDALDEPKVQVAKGAYAAAVKGALDKAKVGTANDPAFKDALDEPKVQSPTPPERKDALRQKPEIPANRPIKVSDSPAAKPKVQTLEEFNASMDKAVKDALDEDRNKVGAKPRTTEGMKRDRAATMYDAMPSSGQESAPQYVELSKVKAPSQDVGKGENYGPMPDNSASNKKGFREAHYPKQGREEQKAGEKYTDAELLQKPVVKAYAEKHSDINAISEASKMPVTKFDAVNARMNDTPMFASAYSKAVEKGDTMDSALNKAQPMIEKVVRNRANTNLEMMGTEKDPNAQARADLVAGMKAQYGDVNKIDDPKARESKRLTTLNPAEKQYSEMASVDKYLQNDSVKKQYENKPLPNITSKFPPDDVAALMGAAGKAAGQRSNDSLSSVDPKASSKAPDNSVNTKAGQPTGISH